MSNPTVVNDPGPDVYNIIQKRDAAFRINAQLTDSSNNPINITGWKMRFQIVPRNGSTPVDMNTNNGMISFPDAVNGFYQILWPQNLVQIAAWTLGDYDLLFVDGTGVPSVPLTGTFQIVTGYSTPSNL